MEGARTLIWDLPTRLFHWALVCLVCFSWWSAEEGGTYLKYHFWSGYGILALVLFRVLWGFAGGRYARFGNFLRGPRTVWQSARELLGSAPFQSTGHNPLGGWMVIFLLIALLVQAGTGLFANDDLFNEGPRYAQVSKSLSDKLTAVHHFNFGVLATLIGMHVAAILYHAVFKRENLVAPMIHGYKPLRATSGQGRALRALACIVVSVFMVWGIVSW